ncbi:MAG: disulfide bond formation protein B [Pseudomonadota bacterium]
MSRIVACLAGLGSAALLLGAFYFQYGEGLAPCAMCIWQRYPHVLASALGIAVLFAPSTTMMIAGTLATVTTSAIGVFHTGVEQTWWDGPSTCTSGDITHLTPDELLDQIMNAPMVRCDEIVWAFGGISMAGWNAIISAVLALVWIGALTMRVQGR